MPGLDLQSPPINTNRLAELLEWTHRLWGWLEANSNIILGKTAYGSSDTGMFAGDDSGTYKVDIGNDTHYFRFNGTVISFNSANASLSEDGVLTITNVVATDGNIGGFHLDSVEGLWSGEGPDRVQLKPDGGIWAGAELPENAPFYVDINGTSVLNATNITIGEEGFLRTKDKNSFDSLTDGIWVGFDNGYYKLRIGNANKYIEWDGVEMTIRGKLNASDIETGTLHADRIEAGTIVTNHVADDNITRSWSYYTAVANGIDTPDAWEQIAITDAFIPIDKPLLIFLHFDLSHSDFDSGDTIAINVRFKRGSTVLWTSDNTYFGEGMGCASLNVLRFFYNANWIDATPGTSSTTISAEIYWRFIDGASGSDLQVDNVTLFVLETRR